MKKIILAAAAILAASGSIAAADEFGPKNRYGDGAPIHAARSGTIDFTPTASIGSTRHYTADENSPWNRFGDGEFRAAGRSDARSGIDYAPTGSIGSGSGLSVGVDHTAQAASPWNRYGDGAPASQVLR